MALLGGPASFIPGTAKNESAETALGVVPLRAPTEGAVQLVIRPEQARFLPNPDGPDRVLQRRFLGRCWQIVCQTAAGEVTVESDASPDDTTGRVEITAPLWAIKARPAR